MQTSWRDCVSQLTREGQVELEEIGGHKGMCLAATQLHIRAALINISP